MAYVVARRNGRFELRESVHTPNGPRARTLAGFAVLSDDVLARAAARAQRPFDAAAVVDSGRRAGAQITAAVRRATSPAHSRGTASPAYSGGTASPAYSGGTASPAYSGGSASPARSRGSGSGPEDSAESLRDGSGGDGSGGEGSGRFLAATARMARTVRRHPSAERMSPGEALIDLLGFADTVRTSQPPRPWEPLGFPAIARLVGHRRRPAGLAHR